MRTGWCTRTGGTKRNACRRACPHERVGAGARDVDRADDDGVRVAVLRGAAAAGKGKTGGRLLEPLPSNLGAELDAMMDPARVGGSLVPPQEVPDTPDAVWEDLCRALREL